MVLGSHTMTLRIDKQGQSMEKAFEEKIREIDLLGHWREQGCMQRSPGTNRDTRKYKGSCP